jgi:hypothetical protein
MGEQARRSSPLQALRKYAIEGMTDHRGVFAVTVQYISNRRGSALPVSRWLE